eukprot:TRINITY_DN12389_c0_g1_i1.p1 TRINITY_DN12389_c0_g1~~TRINITY_DN12389_c0_g1_i1.p1  ORF type:complete len:342 (+),score=71.61 TRINITY_DN12389_c0_g1_i1:99-1028(+)
MQDPGPPPMHANAIPQGVPERMMRGGGAPHPHGPYGHPHAQMPPPVGHPAYGGMRYAMPQHPPQPQPHPHLHPPMGSAPCMPACISMQPAQCPPPHPYYYDGMPQPPAPPQVDRYVIPGGGMPPPNAYRMQPQHPPPYGYPHQLPSYRAHRPPRRQQAPRSPRRSRRGGAAAAAAAASASLPPGLFDMDGEVTNDYETLLALDACKVTVCVSDEQYAREVEEVRFSEDQCDTPCAVCREDFADDKTARLAKLPCGHTFHSDCIRTWLGMSTRCPVCNWDEWKGEKKVIDPAPAPRVERVVYEELSDSEW